MLEQRLKAARKAKKLTQDELAKILKTTKGTISNYENGHSTPSNEMLIMLSEALDCSTDYLLGRTNIPNNKEIDKLDEFDTWLNDPQTNIFFKEFIDSPEERREALLKVWEIIKNDKKSM